MNTASVIAPAYIHSSIKRRKNTWYSVRDGNWTDPLTWQSNASKRWNYPCQTSVFPPVSPQLGDDIFINHTVTCNLTAVPNQAYSINNLYISGTFLFISYPSMSLQINGDLQVTGTLSMVGADPTGVLILMGVNNFINNLIPGTGNIIYNGFISQDIMSLTYYRLSIAMDFLSVIKNLLNFNNTSFSKNFTSNTTVLENFGTSSYNGYFSCKMTTDLKNYNLTVNGTSAIGADFYKTGSGTILFTGLLTLNVLFDVSTGNPTIECRGGISFANGGIFNSGTGTWSFTTNNQSLNYNFSYTYFFTCNILISGAITITAISSTSILDITGTLNGNNAASTFDNRGVVFYKNAQQPMLTGVLQTNNAANTFKYNLAGNQNVSGGTYRIIEFGGSGVKTLQGNVIVNVTAGGSQSTTGTATVNLNGFTITTI